MIIWSFVYNDYYTKKLIREGYEFQESDSKRDHPKSSVEETTPTPEDTRDSSFETPKVPAASPEDLYADLQVSASDQAESQPSAQRGIEAASPEPVSRAGGCVLVIILVPVFVFVAGVSMISEGCSSGILMVANVGFLCDIGSRPRPKKIPEVEYVIEVEYVNGRKEGLETQLYPSGQTLRERSYVNGRLEGLETFFDKYGNKTSESNYVNGQEVGPKTVWSWRAGQYLSFEKHYFNWQEEGVNNWQKEGLETEWMPNGHKLSEKNFVRGEQDGLETSWNTFYTRDATTTEKEGGNQETSSNMVEKEYKEYEGRFVNGLKEGLERWYYPEGTIDREVNYLNGKYDGVLTQWYRAGQKSNEKNYVNGELEGLSTIWHRNGQKANEDNYVNGKLEGLSTGWQRNGQKEREINYVNGEREGLSTSWHHKGQKASEENYVNGELEGLSTSWHRNGQKTSEENYVNGERQGPAN